MFRWMHKFGSPPFVFRWAGRLAPWLGFMCLASLLAGLYLGLVKAPIDYQQGNSYRIIYIHVPAAWMSMFVYFMMALSSAIFLVWRLKIADLVAVASAPLGASFTFIALVSGSIWGKPTWGTWWVWDARLTSELVLLFLYLGYIALRSSIEHRTTAARAAALLAIVGVINLPIIHFSVDWWQTLHQPATLSKFEKPSIHLSMLVPLLLMVVAFQFMYFHNLCLRLQSGILQRDGNAKWFAALVDNQVDNQVDDHVDNQADNRV